MRVVVTARNEGKTTELILQAADLNGYIVCLSVREAASISQQAQEMGVNINFPITFREFLERDYFGINIGVFHIDNADMLLQSLTIVPIETISITNHDASS